MSHCTIAAWPSPEMSADWPGSYGDLRLLIAEFDRTDERTSATAEWKAGAALVSLEFWMRTISVCGSACGNAFCRIRPARWDWLTLASCVSLGVMRRTMP